MSEKDAAGGDQAGEQSGGRGGDERGAVAWWHLHRRLYDWVLHWARTPYGGWALFILSFAESSFFPVPPDVLLAPMTLGNRRKWWRFALSCSLASVLGGVLGYGIGVFLWATVGDLFHDHVPGFGRDVVELRSGESLEGVLTRDSLMAVSVYRVEAVWPVSLVTVAGGKRAVQQEEVNEGGVHIKPFSKVGALYEAYDWKIVATAGFTPLPYKVITITAGVFRINFLIFVIASALSRSARFFLVAGLFGKYGEAIKPFVDKYFNWLCVLFLLLLVGGFMVLKVMH